MTGSEYQKLAMTTLNNDLDERDVLINGVMGLCGEAGEVIDHVKKHLSQGHELDKAHLAMELGDIAWYLAETATAIGYDLDDIFKMNIEKLKRRYPDGFSYDDSINRASDDK
ncbi:MAG: nucleoside triphosphate pyrophosphohydrolase family protein [Clostridia bacterium]|nr:nucleoside triphosphate pyrophosphohydrolase family protein [Clostridia bacterium]